jgi:hypothetical protein
VEQKRNSNFQIKTEGDIAELTTEFPNLDGFLDCSLPQTARVTQKGKFTLAA